MNARYLFICAALVLFASSAFADGTYQRTKDRKTLVWNDDPQLGDAATWSGDRDEDRYATGYGTLVWYKTKDTFLTGSNIPSTKHTIFGRYLGNMVRGKFNGPVTVDTKGKTFHATFVEGKRAGNWAAGPAATSRDQRVAARESVAEPEPPAAGPSFQGSVNSGQRPEITDRPPLVAATSGASRQREGDALGNATAEPPAEGPSSPANRTTDNETTVRETPSPEIDDSLRALIGPPPSGLRTDVVADSPLSGSGAASAPAQMSISSAPPPNVAADPPSHGNGAAGTAASTPSTAASPPASTPSTASSTSVRARLTEAEVVALAEIEARKHGYNLDQYQRPQVRYTTADDTWSVAYEQPSVDRNGMGKTGKRFTIGVEDKTKKTSIQK